MRRLLLFALMTCSLLAVLPRAAHAQSPVVTTGTFGGSQPATVNRPPWEPPPPATVFTSGYDWPDDEYNDKFPEYQTEWMLDEQVWFPW